MPNLYVMVALPRAGKSTYVERKLKNIIRVSADQLRILISGERSSPRKEPAVWWVRSIMLEAIMQQGFDVVVDQTNVTRDKRKPLLELARKYGYRSIAIVIKTDKETCRKRAIETRQEDLLPVIERMASNYEEVTAEEGFDEIIFYSQDEGD